LNLFGDTHVICRSEKIDRQRVESVGRPLLRQEWALKARAQTKIVPNSKPTESRMGERTLERSPLRRKRLPFFTVKFTNDADVRPPSPRNFVLKAAGKDKGEFMLNGAAKVMGSLLIAVASVGRAEPPPASDLPPQMQMVEGVLVPVPGEIFRVLDRFKEANWPAVQNTDLASLPPAGSPARIALSLGLVIGEGFVAVAAEDSTAMQGLGKEAVKLARALGVEKTIVRREKSIIEHARRKEWQAVRQEWSNASSDLKTAMVEIRSEPVAQLISLGGWLRGVEALSDLISRRDSMAEATLLRQPAVLAYFEERLTFLEKRTSTGKDPLIASLRDALRKLSPLMGTDRESAFSRDDVRKIHQISASLVRSICAPGAAG
jgi:hypothetical protein